ncbi:polysaccharide pyruvyl transferase family protein [Microbacterium sp. NPDC089189]|uniref:polysaccharide pyruvyl transferase family protein n=1 Tax=Microbacterium sp. NPDC089189 TaxID=3154972 RepID=UPI0034191E22
MSSASTPTALLGAYERDNFGDVLFLEITSRNLSSDDLTVAAPFGLQDDFRPLDADVKPLKEATQSGNVEAVWMVGGETGGTSMPAAYRMAASQERYDAWRSLPPRSQNSRLMELTGRSVYGSPYLPRMSATSGTLKTRLVINSAGLSGLSGLIGHRADESWGAVHDASYISVRDSASARTLERRSVSHALAPDLVHSLRTSQAGWLAGNTDTPGYALIQVKESSLARIGSREFASILLNSPALRGLDLRLFVAGRARGHDSVKLYREVIESAKRTDPSRPISIADPPTAMEKAELIARAALWVGTSLHGLIISSSFEVPRVGLELEKLTRYATTWGDPMPVGVPLEAIGEAASVALHSKETAGRADRLAEAANASFERARSAAETPLTASQMNERHDRKRRLAVRSNSRFRTALTGSAESLRAWRHR